MMYRRILQPPLGNAIKSSWLLKSHPYIPAAEQTLIATNANIGVARAVCFPQITLTGEFGWGEKESGS
jgi:multidrug efflux system outer membrane protein